MDGCGQPCQEDRRHGLIIPGGAESRRKQARARLWRILRGHRALQASSDPWSIPKLNEQLTALDLRISAGDYSRRVFEGPRDEVEIAARQVLLSSTVGGPLSAAILESLGEKGRASVAPIPGEWVAHLRSAGFRVSRVRSGALFAEFVLKRFLGGLGQIAAALRQPAEPSADLRFAHFVDIRPDNLPRPSGRESYDVVSWYLQWAGRIPCLDEIRHPVAGRTLQLVQGVAVRPALAVLPGFPGKAEKALFIAWCLYAIVAAVIGMVTGRWVNALLLGDAAKARQVGLVRSQQLAREYLFSLSTAVYRPLWTYAAERRGSTITMFNYAASFYRFQTECGPPPGEPGFESMTWPRVLLWSEPLVRYSRPVLKRVARVELVPPIWFSDSDEELPVPRRPCVAVFDVSPVRPACIGPFTPEIHYRNYEIGRQFLDDVYSAVTALGYDMMWKRKRAYGEIHDRRYIRFATEVASRPQVIDVPPGISAFRVVAACQAVISQPFTSTSLIGLAASRPSVFYDPVGVLFPEDRAAQGIPLLSSRQALVDWLAAQSRHLVPSNTQ